MTTPTDEAPRLTDNQIADVMKLLKGADTVEMKVSIPTDAHRATIQGLPLDPVEAQPRQIWFFDTPDLTLNKAGICRNLPMRCCCSIASAAEVWNTDGNGSM